MKYIKYQDQNVSAMAAGCMRIAGFTAEETDTFIRGVLDLGIMLTSTAADIVRSSSVRSSKKIQACVTGCSSSPSAGSARDTLIFSMPTSWRQWKEYWNVFIPIIWIRYCCIGRMP